MSNKAMIKSHEDQIRCLEIERNVFVLRAKDVNEVQQIISSYARDIKVYEDDIKKLEVDVKRR